MTEPSPDSFPRPQEAPSEVQLDSWKEIAAYVKRDVSTVQRWEKREGMPVHRHQHDKRGSVYALRSELDAWFESRKSRLLAEDPEQRVEASEGLQSEPGQRTGRAARLLLLATAVVLAGVRGAAK